MKKNYQSPAVIICPLREHSVICTSQAGSTGSTNPFEINDGYDEME